MSENNDQFQKTLNSTGEWLIIQGRSLVVDVKSKGVSRKNKKLWKELQGRMNHLVRDLKKITNQGEEWKNEN
jgi:hypothetical protein